MSRENTHQGKRNKLVRSPAPMVFCVLGIALSTSCRTRSFDATPASQIDASRAMTKYDNFCLAGMDVKREQERDVLPAREPVSQETSDANVQFWTRKQIVAELKSWQNLILDSKKVTLLKPEYVHTERGQSSVSDILAAYSVAYQDMTRERDEKRCEDTGPMRDASENGPTNEMLNHALADLMTRNLVNISKGCLLKSETGDGYRADPNEEWARWEFCDLYLDTFSWRQPFFTSMTIAMSSTMIYLTGHISAALSALPFLDRVWAGTTWTRNGVTQELSWSPDAVELKARRAARIAFMQEAGFKRIFDAFNGFLAQNLTTVSASLGRRRMMWNDGVHMASGMAERMGIMEKKIFDDFTVVRNEAWQIGIRMAEGLNGDPKLNPNQHPFLITASAGDGDGGGYLEINTGRPLLNPDLLRLEEFLEVRSARKLTWKMRLLVENGSMWAGFALMGAKSYADGLEGDPGLIKRIVQNLTGRNREQNPFSAQDVAKIDACAEKAETNIQSEFTRKQSLADLPQIPPKSKTASGTLPQACSPGP